MGDNEKLCEMNARNIRKYFESILILPGYLSGNLNFETDDRYKSRHNDFRSSFLELDYT